MEIEKEQFLGTRFVIFDLLVSRQIKSYGFSEERLTSRKDDMVLWTEADRDSHRTRVFTNTKGYEKPKLQ